MVNISKITRSWFSATADIKYRNPAWTDSTRFKNLGGEKVAHIGYHEYCIKLSKGLVTNFKESTKILNIRNFIFKDYSNVDRVFGKLSKSEKYKTLVKFVYDSDEASLGNSAYSCWLRLKKVKSGLRDATSSLENISQTEFKNLQNFDISLFRGILKREYIFTKPETNAEIGDFYLNFEHNIKSKLIQSGLFEQYFSYNFTYVHTQLLVMVTLAAILYFLSKILSKKIFNLDKKSAYECGFEPFLILTTSIEIGFVLVAFIFLIFDLELIFLSGFLISNGSIGSFGIILVLIYLSSVWIMVFLEVFTGVLSWPVWNIYKTNLFELEVSLVKAKSFYKKKNLHYFLIRSFFPSHEKKKKISSVCAKKQQDIVKGFNTKTNTFEDLVVMQRTLPSEFNEFMKTGLPLIVPDISAITEEPIVQHKKYVKNFTKKTCVLGEKDYFFQTLPNPNLKSLIETCEPLTTASIKQAVKKIPRVSSVVMSKKQEMVKIFKKKKNTLNVVAFKKLDDLKVSQKLLTYAKVFKSNSKIFTYHVSQDFVFDEKKWWYSIPTLYRPVYYDDYGEPHFVDNLISYGYEGCIFEEIFWLAWYYRRI